MVYPGMEILQDNRLCTLGYVDPVQKIAYTAGHCRSGAAAVTDKNRRVIGHLAAFRDNTPSGTTVATDQLITDYEAIVLADGVTSNNILPGGRPRPRFTGAGSGIAVGTKVYWDATNKVATATASTNKYLGKTTKVAADGDATVRVRLTP